MLASDLRRWSARGLCALLITCGCTTVGVQQRRTTRPFVEPVLTATLADATANPGRVLHVRAYADQQYRAEVRDWRERIGHLIERASAVTEHEFGVRLQVESVRPWERQLEPDRLTGRLRRVLDLLVREDAAFEVDWVVGFVGALPTTERSDGHGGLASAFGRHFVVRAMDDTSEYRLFLHEWAHTLGAVHDCETSWIMSQNCIPSSDFSRESAWLVRLGLYYRDRKGGTSLRKWADAYRTGMSSITSAHPGCHTLVRDLKRNQALLFLASRAYVPLHDALPQIASAPWFVSVVRSLKARTDAVREWVKLQVPHGTTDRITVVDVSLDETGAVANVEVLLSSGFAPLDDEVVSAVWSQPHLISPPPEYRRGYTFSVGVEF
jgi:Metallo-peptidase family M12/TonB C terminal